MTVRCLRIWGPVPTTTANADLTVYTVPSGMTLVLRTWTAWFSGTAGHCFLQVNPAGALGTAPIARLDAGAELAAADDSWMAFGPGDVLIVQASIVNCYTTGFGALLDGAV